MKYVGLAAALLFIQCKAQDKPPLEKNQLKEIAGQQNRYAPHTLIIFYDAETGNGELLKEAKNYGAEIIHYYNTLKGIAIKIPENRDMQHAINFFKKVKGVTSVHRDQIQHLHKAGTPSGI